MVQVAFLWHMHQPLYIDPNSGTATLPWVRLHACRAYLDMISLAQEFPSVHCTFNLVPVLVHQLLALAEGGRDLYRDLAARPASDLGELEARFVIEHFFQASWDCVVYPNPGYRRLLDLRGGVHVRPDAVHHFSVADLRDLQIWFNLGWFGFTALREFPELQTLRQKQRGFTESDKRIVFDAQDRIVDTVLKKYQQAFADGTSELSTTPYFHPILPLLCDSDSALMALPHSPLPAPPIRRPEDASAQIRKAIELHCTVFGALPQGLWPSEGSVSDALPPLLKTHGLRWFASSEGILHHSKLDDVSTPPKDNFGRPSILTPYHIGDCAVFFRHLELSDRIGFVYSRMVGQDAASDLIARIRHVASDFSSSDRRPPLVPIVLDGENPWEHYEDGGEQFLRCLYQTLSASKDLEAVTFSEHLDKYPPVFGLSHLWAGSWVHSNFAIWAGHQEDLSAWQRIRAAGDFLDGCIRSNSPPASVDPPTQPITEATFLDPASIEAACMALYAAEGSDWFWWYGDEFSSQCDYEFDRLFRAHLASVYDAVGAKIPRWMALPIKGVRGCIELAPTPHSIRPTIGEALSDAYGWNHAGTLRLWPTGGAMARGATLLRELRYGHNPDDLFLRLEFGEGWADLNDSQCEIDIMITEPALISLRIPIRNPSRPHSSFPYPRTIHNVALGPQLIPDAVCEVAGPPDGHLRDPLFDRYPVRAAQGGALEIAFPRQLLGENFPQRLDFVVVLIADGAEVLRFPARSVFRWEIILGRNETEASSA